MNPFAERINPLSLSAGNPDLKPEKIHSVEVGWLWHNDTNASLMTTVYYRYLTNQITEVSRYIDGGVLLTTKENLDQSHNAGLELIWSYSINRWLSFNWNANGYFNQINAEKLGFLDTGILSRGHVVQCQLHAVQTLYDAAQCTLSFCHTGAARS